MYCQLEALRHCLAPSVRRILEELPDTLDETYERVLREINKANREHARRLLQCLTVAVRPLRVEELAEVLAIDFNARAHGGIPQLNANWRWTDQHQAVLSTCSSLIAIVDDDGGSQVVQFSHFSVKEYLTSDRLGISSVDISRYRILLEPAHTIIAQTFFGVLLRLDDHDGRENAKEIPLVEYATQYFSTMRGSRLNLDSACCTWQQVPLSNAISSMFCSHCWTMVQTLMHRMVMVLLHSTTHRGGRKRIIQ